MRGSDRLWFELCSSSAICEVPRASHLTSESQITHVLSEDTEKAMAPRSSTLAWKIPWMKGPGGLQSMGR